MMNTVRRRWPAVVVPVILVAVWVNHSRANAPEGRYIIANGTVYDTKSQLSWEQNASPDGYTWDGAQYHCQNLGLDGAGWRVPSVKELQTIVDEGRIDPGIDVMAFPTTVIARYWTSTLRANDMSQAWLVHFDYGATSLDDLKNPHRVRCVR